MGKKTNGIASGKGQGPRGGEPTSQVPAAREQNAEEVGQGGCAANAIDHLPAPPRHSDDPRVQQIMALARDRTYWMQMRLRNTARLAAEIRRHLQPTRGQEDEWSESTKSEALKIVQAAVDHESRELKNHARVLAGRKPLTTASVPDGPSGLVTAPFVVLTAKSLAHWQMEETRVLDAMTELAGTFSIAEFVNSPERKGFTLAGLAVIIGHAGHPLDYPKKGHLWKRLGLAPYSKNGVMRAGSSWGRFGGLDKNDWIELGYSRSRLGDIFGKITQPLLYAQHRASGPALGPYGEAYGRYKARQKQLNESGAFAEEAARQVASAKKAGKKPQKALLEGKLPDSAINARALRYMTKKLIADLWSAWRRLDQARFGDKPGLEVSPAASDIERKAIVGVPQSEAMVVLPTAQPNEGEAIRTEPDRATGAMPSRHPKRSEANERLRGQRAGSDVPTSVPIPRQQGRDRSASGAIKTLPAGAEPNRRRKGQKPCADVASNKTPSAADPTQEAA